MIPPQIKRDILSLFIAEPSARFQNPKGSDGAVQLVKFGDQQG